MDMQLPKLNPALDAKSAAAYFKEHGRVHIPNFLEQASADAVHGLLSGAVPWALTYNEGSESYETDLQELTQVHPQQRQQFIGAIFARARTDFQFMFNHYPVTQAIKEGRDTGHPIHMLDAFVNNESFLGFMRELTGESEIELSDALVARFDANHFLLDHEDLHDSHDRVAAWVLNMTPNWNRNWGGHLVFYDQEGNIIEGFVPSYNALNVLAIPQAHAVIPVTPFAGGSRYTITGWVRKS